MERFRRVVYDQALKVLAPKEPPAVEKIFNLALKLNAELDILATRAWRCQRKTLGHLLLYQI